MPTSMTHHDFVPSLSKLIKAEHVPLSGIHKVASSEMVFWIVRPESIGQAIPGLVWVMALSEASPVTLWNVLETVRVWRRPLDNCLLRHYQRTVDGEVSGYKDQKI